jgi:hypothetical protein
MMRATSEMSDEKQPESPAPPGPPASEGSDGGEGDDALARLPPPRPRRSPLVALAVIAVGALLLVHLVDDTRYALAPTPAADLGDARAALASGKLADNRFVSLSGMPDRRNALLFEPKGDSYRRAFWRLLGTDTKVLVRADETATRHALSDRFTGRLRRFDALPWAEQVRLYYRDHVHATRLVDLASFRAHGADPSKPLTDRAGDPLSLPPDEPVFLEVDFPDEYKVLLSKKQFAVEEDARHEMAQLGVPFAPAETTTDGYLYVVRLAQPTTAVRDAFLKKLDERGFLFASRRERFHAKAGELRIEGEQLSLPVATGKDEKPQPRTFDLQGGQLVPRSDGRVSLPWPRIASIQVSSPIAIPADAWLLVEGEAPGDFRWVLAIDALVALFILFNVFVLVRTLRRPPAPPPTT